jgi:hypothetical protein
MRDDLLEPRYNLGRGPHVLVRQAAVRFIAKLHFDSAIVSRIRQMGQGLRKSPPR